MNTGSDTIAAIATPLGTGGVGVIRLSGMDSWVIAQKICPGHDFKPGCIAHRWLMEPDNGDGTVIDEVLVLPFKAPHSFTGEDCIEIQCHGGLSLIQKALSICLTHGAILATAGEFTKRAVLNNKIDLTQAESVLDLIHAEGEALIKAAAYNLKYRHIGTWLEENLQAIACIQAEMTASIDFPDEVEEPNRQVLIEKLELLITMLTHRIMANQKNTIIRQGYKIAIIGKPNAGKSSLFNVLLAKEKAIVTDIAGTTRDILEETMQVNGIPLVLMDTAGLRENSTDKVEQIGIERSHAVAENADAVIWVLDATTLGEIDDEALIQNWGHKPGLVVFNKQDLPGFSEELEIDIPSCWQKISVSTFTGHGIDAITTWLNTLITKQLPSQNKIETLLSNQQVIVLQVVLENMKNTQNTLKNQQLPIDLATGPLTDALLALQGLLGRDTTEEMLDKVFSQFCVGK